MDGGDVGDEVWEDGWNSLDELGVEEADPRKPVHVRVLCQISDEIARGLVLELEHVALLVDVVPDDHGRHEDERKQQGEEAALYELVENGGEVEDLDRAKDHEEEDDPPDAGLPYD